MTDTELDYQISEVRYRVRNAPCSCDRDKRQLAALEAEKANRKAEAKKTVGQQVAENVVRESKDNGDESEDYPFGFLFDGFYIPSGHHACIDAFRIKFAAAIDKAVSDEREACAKVAEDSGRFCLASQMRFPK